MTKNNAQFIKYYRQVQSGDNVVAIFACRASRFLCFGQANFLGMCFSPASLMGLARWQSFLPLLVPLVIFSRNSLESIDFVLGPWTCTE